MRTFLENEDVPLVVPFTRDDEPFVPDVGSVRWTLRNQAGAKVLGFVGEQVVTNEDTTQIAITIPAAQNELEAGSRFEKRTVVVTGTVGGHKFEILRPYRLIAWLNHSVSPDNVRAYVGVDSGELPDSVIDIPSAYFRIERIVGQQRLEVLLTEAGHGEQDANRAITSQAVLDLIPSLRQRLSQKESDGSMEVTRAKLDIDALQAAAQSELETLFLTIAPSPTNPVDRVWFSVAPMIDPITGV